MTEKLPRPGRPRDPAKDLAVLVAARRLLGEVGYRQTTISAIARSAGVNAPAIYRRWPTRESLLEEAVHGPGRHVLPEPTADLHADLVTWTTIFLARAASPAARAGVPGLLSDAATDVDRARLFALQDPIRKAFAERLDAAADAGEIPGPAPTELLFEILSGATTVRGLIHGDADADAFVADLAASLYVLARHGSEISDVKNGGQQ